MEIKICDGYSFSAQDPLFRDRESVRKVGGLGQGVVGKKTPSVVCCALANKLARIAWAITHSRLCSKGNDGASLAGRLIIIKVVPNLVLRRLIIDDMNGNRPDEKPQQENGSLKPDGFLAHQVWNSSRRGHPCP